MVTIWISEPQEENTVIVISNKYPTEEAPKPDPRMLPELGLQIVEETPKKDLDIIPLIIDLD